MLPLMALHAARPCSDTKDAVGLMLDTAERGLYNSPPRSAQDNSATDEVSEPGGALMGAKNRLAPTKVSDRARLPSRPARPSLGELGVAKPLIDVKKSFYSSPATKAREGMRRRGNGPVVSGWEGLPAGAISHIGW